MARIKSEVSKTMGYRPNSANHIPNGDKPLILGSHMRQTKRS